MCIWQSKKLLKTGKLWHPVVPKGLKPEELDAFKKETRTNKFIKLGITFFEKKVENKAKAE
jgi:hypothetical protein